MKPDDLVELVRRDSQRLDQRISDLDVHLRARMDDTNKRIDDTNTRIGHDQIDRRFDQIDAHFGRIDRRFDEFASSLCAFERRLSYRLQSMQTELCGRIDTMQTELGRRIDTMQTDFGRRIDTMQTDFGRRIDAVQQFRLQGIALAVALTATSAIVGTFALQLFAAL